MRNQDGRDFRLSWEGDADEDAAGDRRRALPAGNYTLRGYRIVAADADGNRWHLSATGGSIRKLQVESGKDLAVDIDGSIHIGKRIHRKRIAVVIQGEHRAGLSIYKEGRRIPIRYRIIDGDGRPLAAGKIEYG